MKLKIFFKILFILLSICFLLYGLHKFFYCLIQYIDIFNMEEIKTSNQYERFIEYFVKDIFSVSIILIFSILFFLIVNFKDFKFITDSALETIKLHKETKTAERTAKKQAKLVREIAEKQAELDELNNLPKTE